MDEKVEKVARAICIASHVPENGGWSAEDIADFANDHWEGYTAEAIAAIAAICTDDPVECVLYEARK
jgi:hypothetical protein